MKTILGLDLGTNSVGWAWVSENDQGEIDQIIDLGCRIYPTVVEGQKDTLKNANRRSKRLMRRVIQRRARRRRRLMHYLAQQGLLPVELADSMQPESILNRLGDPYELRAAALDRELSPHELGRALLHLGTRRGFLSNRKVIAQGLIDDPDTRKYLEELEEADIDGKNPQSSDQNVAKQEKAKEEGQNLKKIAALRTEIGQAGYRTLGEYLWQRVQPMVERNQHKAKSEKDLLPCRRNRDHADANLLTDRQMYREELAQICEKQSAYHPQLEDVEVRKNIENIIFYQRPLKFKANSLGKCSLEPRKLRARLGRLECQRFRYLQDINHLQYLDPDNGKMTSLDSTQRTQLADYCENHAKVTYAGVRRVCKLPKEVNFNLEKSKKLLKGNETACKIRRYLGEEWDAMDAEKQFALVEDLMTIKNKKALKDRLQNHWQLDQTTAIPLCLIDLDDDTTNHSLKAIRKLLPELERGKRYDEARVDAGYGYAKESIDGKEKLPLITDELPNPVVMRALHELRRVVNALIQEHGKPDMVRIEMARDLKMNKKQKQAYEKQQRENERRNEEAKAKYREYKEKQPKGGVFETTLHTKDALRRYRIWEDQSRCCIYSGKSIGQEELFSHAVELDHIIPRGRKLDNSYLNLVICLSSENQLKRNRTPIDAFGDNDKKWHQIKERLKRWPKALNDKRKRFYITAKELEKQAEDGDFIASQLNDTRYICREAQSYVAKLGCDVSVSRGQLTAWLRQGWGLNGILGEYNFKERTDHRHHIIDAVVTAAINRSLYQKILKKAAELEQSSEGQRRLLLGDLKPAGIADLAARLDAVIISHAVQRKLGGALHEETADGFIEGIGTVHRYRLNGDFKARRAEEIIDPEVRNLVLNHLENHGNDPKKAFAEGKVVYHADGKTPIRRVRARSARITSEKLTENKLGLRDRQGKIFKWMTYGNIHHVEVLRNVFTGKVHGCFVTMFEAARRARGVGMPRQPMVRRNHGPDEEFLMALHKDDLVSILVHPRNDDDSLDASNGLEDQELRQYMRVQKFSMTTNQVQFQLHTSAVKAKNDDQKLLSINNDLVKKWNLCKHQPNVLGKISND